MAFLSLSLLLFISKPPFFPALHVFSRDVDTNHPYSTLSLVIYTLVTAFILLVNLVSQKIGKPSYQVNVLEEAILAPTSLDHPMDHNSLRELNTMLAFCDIIISPLCC